MLIHGLGSHSPTWALFYRPFARAYPPLSRPSFREQSPLPPVLPRPGFRPCLSLIPPLGTVRQEGSPGVTRQVILCLLVNVGYDRFLVMIGLNSDLCSFDIVDGIVGCCGEIAKV